MADSKIVALTDRGSTPAQDDVVYLTDAAGATDYRITIAELRAALVTLGQMMALGY